MTEHPIPPASQQRLKAALQQFQDLAQVVLEAMDLSNRQVRLELDRGVFVELAEGELANMPSPNGQVEVLT